MPPRRKYIDGEEEQLELLEPLLAAALMQLARTPRQSPQTRDALAWIAREAFRLGYQHAHERSTEPVPGLVDPPDE